MKKNSTILLIAAMVLMAAVPALAEDPVESLNGIASVQFDDSGVITMIDPEDEDTATELGVTFGKMDLDFDENPVPSKAETYPAIARTRDGGTDTLTNFGVTVSDGRGIDNSAWALSATFAGPYTHSTITDGTADFNATITLADGVSVSNTGASAALASSSIAIPSQASDPMDPIPEIPVLSADDSVGVGTFGAYWESGDVSMKLATDFNKIRQGAYTATIVWTLTPEVANVQP